MRLKYGRKIYLLLIRLLKNGLYARNNGYILKIYLLLPILRSNYPLKARDSNRLTSSSSNK
jgi:hypothetical protein